MPLHLYFRPSFKRSFKRLGYDQKKVVKLLLAVLGTYYSSGCNLVEARKIAQQFFYKQLRRPYFEAGLERNIRVVIRREGEKCIAVLAGTHDQIKKFLANV